MKAKFIGESSRDFVKGQDYLIKTNCELVEIGGFSKPMPCIVVKEQYGNRNCPYKNLETLLRNWRVL